MEPEEVRDIILDVTAESLEAQLKAVRRLQNQSAPKGTPRRGRSQVDMVHDVLKSAGSELHINDILDRVERSFGVRLERESVVSALTKKVRRHDRFVRTGKNTFALKEGE
jgi:hypothetical protein